MALPGPTKYPRAFYGLFSNNAFFGRSHFNLLINDPRDDLLKVNDDKKKGRTLKRLFEKLVSKIWNVFKWTSSARRRRLLPPRTRGSSF